MQVHFFGRLADHAGRTVEVAVPPEGCRLDALRGLIAAEHPALGAALERPGVRACVGRDFLGGEQQVDPARPIEFWPPVSGG